MRYLLLFLIGMAVSIPQTTVAAVDIPHPKEEHQEIRLPDPGKPFLRNKIRYHYRQLCHYSRRLIRLAIGLGIGFGLVWWPLRHISEKGGAFPGWVALLLGLWITFFSVVVAALILMWATWPFRLLFWWTRYWGWKKRFARCFRFRP